MNVVGSSLALAVLVLAFVLVPLPQRVWGTLEIEPRDVGRVYVDVPGRLIAETLQPGTVVPQGAVLARLENLDLELEVAELAGRAAEYKSQLSALRQQRFHDAQRRFAFRNWRSRWRRSTNFWPNAVANWLA
ncbi:MAG: hypothetical protein QM775_08825 [Pirellulales bacterium]